MEGTRRSMGFRDFVVRPGKVIHQAEPIRRNVEFNSNATKFLRRMGQSARSATMTPVRTPRARLNSLAVEFSASIINVRPASSNRSESTSRSYFDLGRMLNLSSFSISPSQPKSASGAISLEAHRSPET